MADPIEANYIPDGDDWTITIIGRGRTLTAKAPGIIAARDRTDQLVEELTPDEEYRTVVHLLNGDAVEFTTAYLTARMAKTEPEAPAKPARSAPKAKARAADPEWDSAERVSRRARMREGMLASVSGAQLADIRKQLGMTQVQLAEATGLSQARISQIESGTATSLETLRIYVAGLGGHLDIVARIGNIHLNVA